MFDFDGILFFPVTPFGADGDVNLGVLSKHIDRGLEKGAKGLFVGCGTGEFAALDDDEVIAIATLAVQRAAGRIPVFVGAGGGIGSARARMYRAAAAGVDGVLLFAPNSDVGGQDGLVAYVEQIAQDSPLPLIVYQRGSMRLSISSALHVSRIPNVIGLKDGLGDIERVRRQVAVISEERPDFIFMNGLPTAELTMAAYSAVGVRAYSSAVFSFAPDIATEFRAAFDREDYSAQERLISAFFAPYAEIRAQRSDYAVSLVKAGVALTGLEVGPPRPPLAPPAEEDLAALQDLVSRSI